MFEVKPVSQWILDISPSKKCYSFYNSYCHITPNSFQRFQQME